MKPSTMAILINVITNIAIALLDMNSNRGILLETLGERDWPVRLSPLLEIRSGGLTDYCLFYVIESIF